MDLREIQRLRGDCVDVLDQMFPAVQGIADKEEPDYVMGLLLNVSIELLGMALHEIEDEDFPQAFVPIMRAVYERSKQMRALAETGQIIERMKKH